MQGVKDKTLVEYNFDCPKAENHWSSNRNGEWWRQQRPFLYHSVIVSAFLVTRIQLSQQFPLLIGIHLFKSCLGSCRILEDSVARIYVGYRIGKESSKHRIMAEFIGVYALLIWGKMGRERMIRFL